MDIYLLLFIAFLGYFFGTLPKNRNIGLLVSNYFYHANGRKNQWWDQKRCEQVSNSNYPNVSKNIVVETIIAW